MKADVELDLAHDGDYWICRNATLAAKGETFDDLDEDVKRALCKSGEFPHGAQVTVFMGFDFDTIPTWLRQYHNHYFNRYVTMVL